MQNKRIKQSLHKNIWKQLKNITPSDASMSPINKSAYNFLLSKCDGINVQVSRELFWQRQQLRCIQCMNRENVSLKSTAARRKSEIRKRRQK
jgi:hypothetical protein